MDKVGDVTITNDGATILQRLEVEHPAAKVLVQLADLQDKEVGDGTTSVVVLTGELIREAEKLIDQKIHPMVIVDGWRLATSAARAALEASAVDHSVCVAIRCNAERQGCLLQRSAEDRADDAVVEAGEQRQGPLR